MESGRSAEADSNELNSVAKQTPLIANTFKHTAEKEIVLTQQEKQTSIMGKENSEEFDEDAQEHMLKDENNKISPTKDTTEVSKEFLNNV